MVSMLAWSPVDLGFRQQSGKTKYYKADICCLSAKAAALKSKNKNWSARYQYNVREWSDISTRGLLFQVGKQ
jgi:hypothetical protein